VRNERSVIRRRKRHGPAPAAPSRPCEVDACAVLGAVAPMRTRQVGVAEGAAGVVGGDGVVGRRRVSTLALCVGATARSDASGVVRRCAALAGIALAGIALAGIAPEGSDWGEARAARTLHLRRSTRIMPACFHARSFTSKHSGSGREISSQPLILPLLLRPPYFSSLRLQRGSSPWMLGNVLGGEVAELVGQFVQVRKGYRRAKLADPRRVPYVDWLASDDVMQLVEASRGTTLDKIGYMHRSPHNRMSPIEPGAKLRPMPSVIYVGQEEGPEGCQEDDDDEEAASNESGVSDGDLEESLSETDPTLCEILHLV
jgi:hypothetical protein